MAYHHHRTAKDSTIHRSQTLEQYGYGKIVPRGSRVPQGGVPGDSYRAYTQMQMPDINPQALDVLFGHGYVLWIILPDTSFSDRICNRMPIVCCKQLPAYIQKLDVKF
jgi:hypothetical protein